MKNGLRLKAEKALTRRSDELAQWRQMLPWVRIDKEYRFETDEGKASLADLFRGCSQLLVYHFMFGPEYTGGCPACSAIADGFNGFAVHLEHHDVAMIAAVVAWSFLNNKVHIDDIKRERTKCKAISTVLLISIAVLASPLLLYSNTITGTTAYAQTPGITFPPPIFGSIRSQPAYEVSIPFSSQGKSSFVPQEIAIPTGMTVIWFNNDDGQHSLSTLTNSTYSAPETINSGPIVQEGGSFIHSFTQPGKYVYFDQFNPSAQGVVNVGSTLQTGKNMNMIIGGQNTIPFNPAQPQSMVLSFIPTTVSIPPTTDITYKVTLLDSAKKALYSKNYDDADGILDLELVPVHKAVISSSTSNTTSASKNISSQFTSWGPDFIGEEQVRSDGVYHIRGPVLVQNSPYSIQVSIVAKDNAILPSPISDTFVLSPQSGK